MEFEKLIIDRAEDNGNAVCWKILSGGQPVKMEFKIGAKNGKPKIIEMAAQNFLNEDGINSIIINGRDITERKRTEENLKLAIHDLEQSNSDLEQFAYVASHDLKEPLRMISNYLELLMIRYGKELKAEAAEFVGFAIGGTKRMYELIQGLLDYSRLGKGNISAEPFSISEVIMNSLSNLSYDKKNDKINVGKMPVIRANYTEILQLFQNILSNAIKFSERGKTIIDITCEDGPKNLLFTVADNGIGIEEQYFQRVFKLFERLHTDSEYSGTGIGLTLCRKIVENMGGKIWIESELKKGTKVRFTIPKKGDNENGK
jgi:light-regulated signal transduction histidine kinase (bacteriophytochrome)